MGVAYMAEEVRPRFRIIDFTKVPSAEEGRIGKYDAIVTYQDDAGRVRVITIPWEKLEGKNEDEILSIVADYIRRSGRLRMALIGREIVV